MTFGKNQPTGTKPNRRSSTAPAATKRPPSPSKLDILLKLLSRPEGVSLWEPISATGWQTHSVRGALAGALRRKGHTIASAIADGERRYHIGAT